MLKNKRIESIDLLRGTVMIIMALDHVRDYFHHDAFLYSPTDLSQTNVWLFFTRFITHYCAPVFVFLAGISAYLYGAKRTKKELSVYLFTRGLWLVFVELFIISLGLTFNPSYPIFNLQVIWAIGISMIVLSGMIHLQQYIILAVAVLLIFTHNLLDGIHVHGNELQAFLWSFLHEPAMFISGPFSFHIHYPVLPWIGIMALGYYFGSIYLLASRSKILLITGAGAILLFIVLRLGNIYGDAAHWEVQKYAFLSFLNVTKYPPSLLYTLITLGPAMILLSLAERPLNSLTRKIAVFGRVPFFYYVIHLYLIHFFALIAARIQGYAWSDMILTGRINSTIGLKGYGFNLFIVYLVWIGLIFLLYPFCKWFDKYKRDNQSDYRWLQYL
ncbi:Uncharacterized membrane protein [Chitinophaga sp. YR573]|uniref:DUF1624 domain-containing protein n=1 Tax=Chitinophaga sp. YR573 TaxID=1881040 RepID=UPI0008C69D17|nr:heparan-alpha-glucosaminide N-acetyltransferase domain-containing protein [Chitinophaga sp. YR573]SEV95981.1 Uncharacterized membrane protein [Chitinophaga sp. YR573]